MAFLSKYRVIDLTDERGLMAGHIMAKLGADVVQVEAATGCRARLVPPFAPDGRSLFWSAYAAGKRSITLDYGTAEGCARLLQLLERADFLFESADPGELDRLGLTREVIMRANPRLIHVSITAFGSTGPKANWRAADLTLWAAGGPLSATKDSRGQPLGFSVPQSWLHAAADAAVGALVAHFARRACGRGQHVDISAQASISQSTLGVLTAAALGHEGYDFNPAPPPSRKKTLDLSGSGSRTRKSKWAVRDGLVEMHLGIGKAAGPVANVIYAWAREAGAVPEHLLDWDWVTVPERVEAGEIDEHDIDEARNVMAPFLAQFDRKSLLEEAIRRRVPLAPINHISDVVASEHFAARGTFSRLREGELDITLPWAIARGPQCMLADPRGAPELGVHNDEVFGALSTMPGAGRRRHGEGPAPTRIRQPFDGLFVLDLAWVVAGPAIGRVLADYGAEIVRVESSKRVCTSRVIGPFPGGKFSIQHSACYDECNTGKKSLSLDLNVTQARPIVLDLARRADVVIESFSPGQMARWGLDYARLAEVNPRLVMLSTSLMGQSGPHAGFAGYGNAGAAVGGFQTLVGHPNELPVGPYGPYTDFVGPRFGLVMLLAALDVQKRTGKGCWIDLAQAETGLQLLAPQVADFTVTGRVAAPMGNRSPHCAPHGVFRCIGEDQWVAIVVANDEEWARMAELLEGEALTAEFATLAGRKANEDRLESLIATWTRDRTAADVEALLQGLRIAAHKAIRTEDAVMDPQFLHRGHFVRLQRSDGTPSVVEASRFVLSETPARTVSVAPFIGQHTVTVLRDMLGYSAERIEALRAAGALQ